MNARHIAGEATLRCRSTTLRAVQALIAFAFGAACAGSARASLGGRIASVEADRVHLAARSNATATATHTVHVLTLPNGGVTREFAGPDGVVFAVAWSGPSRPDLRQLLGSRFDTLQADNVRSVHRVRAPLAVNRQDFVLHSGGHPGAFWGVAYLPQQTPAGFSANDMH